MLTQCQQFRRWGKPKTFIANINWKLFYRPAKNEMKIDLDLICHMSEYGRWGGENGAMP